MLYEIADRKATIEALKEVGRWLVLFLASSLIIGLEAQVKLLPDFVKVAGIMINIRQAAVAALTFAGRYIDKYLHETGKEIGNDKLIKGLTRF